MFEWNGVAAAQCCDFSVFDFRNCVLAGTVLGEMVWKRIDCGSGKVKFQAWQQYYAVMGHNAAGLAQPGAPAVAQQPGAGAPAAAAAAAAAADVSFLLHIIFVVMCVFQTVASCFSKSFTNSLKLSKWILFLRLIF